MIGLGVEDGQFLVHQWRPYTPVGTLYERPGGRGQLLVEVADLVGVVVRYDRQGARGGMVVVVVEGCREVVAGFVLRESERVLRKFGLVGMEVMMFLGCVRREVAGSVCLGLWVALVMRLNESRVVEKGQGVVAGVGECGGRRRIVRWRVCGGGGGGRL